MKFIYWIKSKERLRNGAMWVSITSFGLIAAQIIAKWFGYDLTEEIRADIMLLVNTVLIILSTLGIVSNPSKPDSGGYNL